MASLVARMAAIACLFVCAAATADPTETLDVDVFVPGAFANPQFESGMITGTLTYDLTTNAFLFGSMNIPGQSFTTGITSSPLGSIGGADGYLSLGPPGDFSTFDFSWANPLGATDVTQVTGAIWFDGFNDGESGGCTGNCGPPATLTIEAASAPEIDLGIAATALTLLGGALAIMLGKRSVLRPTAASS